MVARINRAMYKRHLDIPPVWWFEFRFKLLTVYTVVRYGFSIKSNSEISQVFEWNLETMGEIVYLRTSAFDSSPE
jgi:hypothetical protein